MATIQSSSSLVHPTATTRAPERKRITRWGKGAFAGLIAGALFITLEMALLELFGKGNIWDPVRLSASIALGNRAVATSTPFTFDIFFVGIMIHFIMSILYAVILGMVIHKLKPPVATLVGAGFGLLIYLFHFYGLESFYPWVAGWRNWIVIVAHLVFGASAAWIYSHLHVRQLMREAGLSPQSKVTQ
jgi:hypothetical protein